MQPIGVFDSGMGGLTVLRALVNGLPNESFIYLGDTARLPYGSKSPATVSRYAIQAAQSLVDANIKLLVVACNTASAVALAELRKAFAPIEVIGVVEPGASAAVKQSAAAGLRRAAGLNRAAGLKRAAGLEGVTVVKNAPVLVLATESTVAGGAYGRAIHRHNSQLAVHARACPLLVALAEEGRVDDAVVDLVLRDYLAGFLEPAQLPGTVLLGCTHFPVFRAALQRLLPSNVPVVDSAGTTATAVAEHLTHTGQLAPANTAQQIRFLATDGAERFARVGPIFFGASAEEVSLVDL